MSKLSRTKLKKTIKKASSQIVEDLNSSDDFVQIPSKVVKKKIVKEKIEEHVSNNLSSMNLQDTEESNVLPSSVICDQSSNFQENNFTKNSISSSSQKRQNCPFCQKTFKIGQEATRLSHLKSCGTQCGLSTEKILEAHRLIERQDEEWRILEMNLPKTATLANNATNIKNRTKNCSRAPNSRMKTELQLSSDPQYDLAIALSKSMANGDEDKIKSESPQKCWLPQPPPIPIKQSLKSKAKTALQVRTESDRAQQITEAVMMVLSAYDSKDQNYKTKSHANDDNVGLRSEILKSLQCLECDLWSTGALTAKNVNFYVEEFLKYSNDSTTKQDKKNWKASERSNVAAAVQDKNLNFSKSKKDTLENVIEDWEKLLESGDQSDLTIYCREEEKLNAHWLVLFVRCKEMLNEIIVENDSKKILTWPNVSKHVAKSFLRFLYSGKLELELEIPSDLTDAECLSQSYPKLTSWTSFIESISTSDLERGFLQNPIVETEEEDEEEEKVIGEATQNMALALELLEDDDTDDEDEEWTEVCHFLSQTQKSTNNATIPKSNMDMDSIKKRKSSVELNDDVNKKSKISDDYESSVTFSPNGTVYSRKVSSPEPDLTGFDENLDSFESDSDVLDSSIPEMSQMQKTSISTLSKLEKSIPKVVMMTEEQEVESDIKKNALEVVSEKEKTPPSKSNSHASFHTPSFLNSSNDEDSINFPPSPFKEVHQKAVSKSSPAFVQMDEPFVASPRAKKPSHSPLMTLQNVQKVPFITSPRAKKSSHSPYDGSAKAENKQIISSSTPMPDYEEMLSPALRQELRRFGLKVIPRRKAVPLLRHIYEETHPSCRKKMDFVDNVESDVEEEEILQSSQESTENDLPEESLIFHEKVDDLDVEDDDATDDIATKFIKFIQNDSTLYKQILLYEPIWLEDVFQRFKDQIGTKRVKLTQIMDILDNECITFRTRSQHKKNVKRNAKKK